MAAVLKSSKVTVVMRNLTPYLYLILFAALVAHPYFITYLGMVSTSFMSSLINAVIMGVGVAIYFVNIRMLGRKDEELASSRERLRDSFKYIGSMNRRLPLLSHVSTSLLSEHRYSKKQKKKLFQELLATAAVSIAKADWGMFRFIDRKGARMAKEIVYTHGERAIRVGEISNKELFEQKEPIGRYVGYCAVRTSDREADTQAFLIVPTLEGLDDGSLSILQAITDQAQLFYKYVFV